jgi:hypothetical protein
METSKESSWILPREMETPEVFHSDPHEENQASR